jgi:hypothetical protein
MNPQVQDLIEKGWRVISDGASGTQMQAPKKMTAGEVGAIVVGVVLIPFFGIGFLVIAGAIVDHIRRKPETKFIFRS